MQPPSSSPPLARLLDLTADAVQACARQVATDLLARCRPTCARRAGAELSRAALAGQRHRVRARLAPKTPPPNVDALLVTALALLWPGPRRPMPTTRWSTRP
jgi:16S rRNA (cytosine967-C5)-methyltransferase